MSDISANTLDSSASTIIDELDPASAVLDTDLLYIKDANGNDLKATMQQVKDFTMPDPASVNTSGLVNTSAQAFSGKKTFTNGIAASVTETTSLSVSDEKMKINAGDENEISIGADTSGDAVIGKTGEERKIPTVASFGSAGQVLGIGTDGKPAFLPNSAEMPIYFATCETAAATEIKAISIPTLINLQPGIEISIMFTNVNSYGSCVGTESNIIADGPKISLNGGTAYPIKIGGEPAGEGFNRAGDIHKFVFDGAAWNDLTADVIYQGSTEAGKYVKKRNGLITEWGYNTQNNGLKTVTFPIIMSNPEYRLMILRKDGTNASSPTNYVFNQYTSKNNNSFNLHIAGSERQIGFDWDIKGY